MKKLWDQTKLNVMVWKLAYARAILYTFSILINSFITANATVVWQNLDTFSRFMIILGCIGSWCTTMIAFLDKTSASLAKGQLPFGNPDDDKSVKKETEVSI